MVCFPRIKGNPNAPPRALVPTMEAIHREEKDYKKSLKRKWTDRLP